MLEGGFRFRRPVPPGTPGLTALALDAHVLAHSPNLWDLRLLDPERRQIPYLLERRDEPLSLELALPQGQPKGRATLYALALPQAGLPASRLVLETDARVEAADARRTSLVSLRGESPSGGSTARSASRMRAGGSTGSLSASLSALLPRFSA